MLDDTITAPATPPGRAGIAVIRVSGAETALLMERVLHSSALLAQPGRLHRTYVMQGAERLAECLAVFFRAPRSYTGEDAAEISVHGNPYLVEEVVHTLVAGGARLARPGEFTFRAFRNGKIDLIQAEAVNNLIGADSPQALRLEFHNLEGQLSQLAAEIRAEVLEAAIRLETAIEFAEEQFLETPDALSTLPRVVERLDWVLGQARFREIFNRGLSVVIAGTVNAGKSSLFNALLACERSIVSPAPGTTRDYIAEKLYVDGFPYVLSDVAGLRGGEIDSVEQEGIRRSRQRLQEADGVIVVLDGARLPQAEDAALHGEIPVGRRLLVLNKCDIAAERTVEAWRELFPGETFLLVSALQRTNLEAVRDHLRSLRRPLDDAAPTLSLNLRQKNLLQECRDTVAAICRAPARTGAEILAEELRAVLRRLGELTGEIGVDDILNGIFAEFCIGK